MAYPDSELRNDTLDPLYGGRPALEFGGLAWQWANNVLRILSAAHLLYNRNSYRTIAPVVDGLLTPGDVAVVDLLTSGPLSIPKVRKLAPGDDGLATTLVLGVCVVGAAVGYRAVVATSGIVPRTITGFVSLTGGAAIAYDYTGGRLKVAAGAETVIGYGDAAGNVLLGAGA